MGRPTSSASSVADSPAAPAAPAAPTPAPLTRSKRNSCSSASTPDELDQEQASHGSRPKRRATNPHIFRYLQHGNPNRLQDRDLKRALEASLEDCQDSWPAEDTASCSSSSDQSNGPSGPSSNSDSSSITRNISKQSGRGAKGRRDGAFECNCSTRAGSSRLLHGASPLCPIHHAPNRPKVQKRFKPVAKKNVYSEEVDFFHQGIMDYISYELNFSPTNIMPQNVSSTTPSACKFHPPSKLPPDL